MIEIQDLSFRYATSNRDTLTMINASIGPGQFSLVAGQSGSGKSTLLRCMNGLIPHFHGGHFAGNATVAGHDTREHAPRDLAKNVGTVFQDPESQLLTDTPEEEISFTLENLGFSPGDIGPRAAATARLLNIERLMPRLISTLSGGERQLVALAAAIATDPAAIVLDEPTSQLDPENSQLLLDALTELRTASGLTVVLAEHRLTRLLPLADDVIHVAGGHVETLRPEGAAGPLMRDGLMPIWSLVESHRKVSSPGDVIAAAESVSFAYGERAVLSDLDLALREGEIVALTGANGSGKTTLLKHFMGLLRPDTGRIVINGSDISEEPIQSIARTVGYVPQHPTIMLHQETVADELAFTLAGLGRDGDIQAVLANVGLSGFEQRHPLDLSGGERQRLAIAAIAVARPRLLLLDEPTRGLSWSAKELLAKALRRLAVAGSAVLVATHDQDFVYAFSDRRVALEHGRLWPVSITDPTPEEADSQNRDLDPVLTISNPG